jgi:uncharacterized membrane protein SpoIIM required for sporulation
VNLDRFVRERSPTWTEVETLVRAARGRGERLGPNGVRRLGELYRSTAADLAFARRAFPGDPLVARLEHLVAGARALVYSAPERRTSFVRFLARGYWELVAARPWPLAFAAALLFGPAVLAGVWALGDAGAAAGLIPEEYRTVTEPRPRDTDLGIPPEERAAFSSQIFTNNIQVSFLAFAGGIAAGLATALVVAYNGVLLGVVTGLSFGAGNGRPLVELVVPHGVLELSCIVVTAAAGLRMGWALVEPGRATRVEALVDEGRRAVLIVLGTIPWLVVAGLVEGFVTGSGLSLVAAVAVGFGLGVLYWALVAALGREGGRAAATPARAPLP